MPRDRESALKALMLQQQAGKGDFLGDPVLNKAMDFRLPLKGRRQPPPPPIPPGPDPETEVMERFMSGFRYGPYGNPKAEGLVPVSDMPQINVPPKDGMPAVGWDAKVLKPGDMKILQRILRRMGQ